MDPKRIMTAAGLLVFALIVFIGVRRFATPAPTSAPVVQQAVVEQIEYVDVLVAAQDIPFGTRVRSEMLEWTQWPANVVIEGFIVSDAQPDALTETANTVTRAPIYVGEPIIERKLVHSGDRGVMAALLNPGMRAVTTRIRTDQAAGGFIRPGDRVDIILTSRIDEAGTSEFVAKTIFENVLVLAIDQIYDINPGPDGGATAVGSSATFEMIQDDAELLEESAKLGDLTLTLRGLSGERGRIGQSAAAIQRDTTENSELQVYRRGELSSVALKGQ